MLGGDSDHFAELRQLLAGHCQHAPGLGAPQLPAADLSAQAAHLQSALQAQLMLAQAAGAACLQAQAQQGMPPHHLGAGAAAATCAAVLQQPGELLLQQALLLRSQALQHAGDLARQGLIPAPPAAAPPPAQRAQRRPAVRRSLSSMFDVVAATEAVAGAGDAAGAAGPSGSMPSPMMSPVAPVTPAVTPAASPAAPDHLLPLQHLLLSDRAQRLSALDAKAIVYRVASDLASLHGSGGIHRHVTVASVGLERSGNLGTARLLPHPANVAAGARRSHTGPKLPGADAYLAPELARCPAHQATYTPAGDMWGLGVVLFVLLSGSHVPFGNRGLCWPSVPNMPGPGESVDKLQRWLDEHLACKLEVLNHLSAVQHQAGPGAGGFEVRVVGFDPEAAGLLRALLRADPAQRPTAEQALRDPWLAEVVPLMPPPAAATLRAPPAFQRAASAPALASPFAAAAASGSYEDMLYATASLAFSPQTPSSALGPVSGYSSSLSAAASADSLARLSSGTAFQALSRGGSMRAGARMPTAQALQAAVAAADRPSGPGAWPAASLAADWPPPEQQAGCAGLGAQQAQQPAGQWSQGLRSAGAAALQGLQLPAVAR